MIVGGRRERELAERRTSHGYLTRSYRTSKEAAAVMAGQRTEFPTAPCVRCGAARWCGHRGPGDV